MLSNRLNRTALTLYETPQQPKHICHTLNSYGNYQKIRHRWTPDLRRLLLEFSSLRPVLNTRAIVALWCLWAHNCCLFKSVGAPSVRVAAPQAGHGADRLRRTPELEDARGRSLHAVYPSSTRSTALLMSFAFWPCSTAHFGPPLLRTQLVCITLRSCNLLSQ